MGKPITPNPGGKNSPEEILGRDDLIEEMWQILEGRNIYMNDLRRIGKTEILHKMQHQAPKEWMILKRDLGGIRTAKEFAARVYKDTYELLGLKKKALRSMTKLLGELSGAEIPSIIKLPNGKEAPWKEILTGVFVDLNEIWEKDQLRTLFLWDEIPFMLDNIVTEEGPQTAMEILDTLRSLSQDYPGIRMVLTGSIGIHHLLDQLRKDGYNNSPLNTFERIAPGPLEAKSAKELALRLIAGAELNCGDVDKVADSCVRLTGKVPFFLHRLISKLPKNMLHSSKTVRATLEEELNAVSGGWDLAHYRDRLGKYYPDNQDAKISLAVLDTLAKKELPQTELRNIVKSIVEKTDDEEIRSVIKRLIQDHYITRDPKTKKHQFYLEVVRRWWAIDRDL